MFVEEKRSKPEMCLDRDGDNAYAKEWDFLLPENMYSKSIKIGKME